MSVSSYNGRRLRVGQVWQSNDNDLRAVRITNFLFICSDLTVVRGYDVVHRQPVQLPLGAFRAGAGGWTLLKEAA